MSSEDHSTEGSQRSRLTSNGFGDLRFAMALLTPVRGADVDIRSAAFGRAVPLFPLVGAAIGGALFGLDWLLSSRLPSPVAAVVLVAAWQLVARGRLYASESPAWTATALIVAAKVVALGLLEHRELALLFAPMLGAWGIVVLVVGARAAQSPARKLAPAVLFNEFAVASLLTLAAVFTFAEGLGILLGVIAAALTVGLRVVLHQRIGGMSVGWVVIGGRLIEVVTLWVLLGVQTAAALP